LVRRGGAPAIELTDRFVSRKRATVRAVLRSLREVGSEVRGQKQQTKYQAKRWNVKLTMILSLKHLLYL
jgi:hypothetical protein